MKLAAVLGLSLTGVAVAQNITTVFTNDTQLIYSRPGTNSGVSWGDPGLDPDTYTDLTCNGGVRATTNLGASLSLIFTGSAVTINFLGARLGSSAQVLLDGVFVQEVTLNVTDGYYFDCYFVPVTMENLKAGSHNVTAVKDEASNYMYLHSFVYTSSPSLSSGTATAATSATSNPSVQTSALHSSSPSSSKTPIIAAVAGVVVLLLGAALAWWLIQRRNRRRHRQRTPSFAIDVSPFVAVEVGYGNEPKDDEVVAGGGVGGGVGGMHELAQLSSPMSATAASRHHQQDSHSQAERYPLMPGAQGLGGEGQSFSGHSPYGSSERVPSPAVTMSEAGQSRQPLQSPGQPTYPLDTKATYRRQHAGDAPSQAGQGSSMQRPEAFQQQGQASSSMHTGGGEGDIEEAPPAYR